MDLTMINIRNTFGQTDVLQMNVYMAKLMYSRWMLTWLKIKWKRNVHVQTMEINAMQPVICGVGWASSRNVTFDTETPRRIKKQNPLLWSTAVVLDCIVTNDHWSFVSAQAYYCFGSVFVRSAIPGTHFIGHWRKSCFIDTEIFTFCIWNQKYISIL